MNRDELLAPALEMEEESDPLLLATLDFEQAARFLDLEQWIVSRLRHAEREITLNLPLIREDGEPAVFSAFRVQHHSASGPTLGPLRLCAHAHLRDVQAAAMYTTWQMALLELPFGGAAGAIVSDPDPLAERELRSLVRGYVRGLHGVVGPYTDVLAPGPGCNEQTMAWMVDYKAKADPRHVATVVGKPPVLWGVAGYYGAIAQGIASWLRHLLGGEVGNWRVNLQGFGQLGQGFARALYQQGGRLSAVADLSGALLSPQGLDLAALESHVEHQGVLFGYPEADAASNANLLEAPADVLILAAAERQITSANAARVRARVVVEAHDGAMTRTAQEILAQRGALVVPYLLATAGAAVAACMEWAQNVQFRFEPPNLNSGIETHVRKLYETLRSAGVEHNLNLNLRRTAMIVAAERVAGQMRTAGRN